MNFFFCEECGKRVTDDDINAGRAFDRKFSGVFCAECATNVSVREDLRLPGMDDRKPAMPAKKEAIMAFWAFPGSEFRVRNLKIHKN